MQSWEIQISDVHHGHVLMLRREATLTNNTFLWGWSRGGVWCNTYVIFILHQSNPFEDIPKNINVTCFLEWIFEHLNREVGKELLINYTISKKQGLCTFFGIKRNKNVFRGMFWLFMMHWPQLKVFRIEMTPLFFLLP